MAFEVFATWTAKPYDNIWTSGDQVPGATHRLWLVVCVPNRRNTLSFS